MLTASFAAAGAGFSGGAFAASGSIAGSAASTGGTGGASAVTSGLGSVLGGNQASMPISLPVDVCANAAAVLGIGLAGCGGGASASSTPAGSAGATSGPGGTRAAGYTSGNGSAGGASTMPGSPRGGTGPVTLGRGSVAGGNQVSAPVSAPASVCGNAAAVLGDSAAGCEGTAGGRRFADTPETGTAPSRAGGASGADGATRNPAVPATMLAADSPSGMSNVSFYSLAIGVLVAGAVALKLAGRRFRGHRTRGHRV
jgi:hypothetical protein